ncbi:MAG TPA: 1-deoxy-D-xylulose-5-phosphate reductoisomerase [Clostridiaceae bacterium]|nr:1-deoxy-D-xylulose-5-phosphate reductoisomerase [Clostridiaceae bacterium]
MQKKISILGSTGSIGIQALEVVRNLKKNNYNIEIKGLAAGKNIDLLEKQVLEFKPEAVSVMDEELADILNKRLKSTGTDVFYGIEGLIKVATLENTDLVLNSVVGVVGLLPTLEAIRKGKNIALANKETLVAAGKIVMEEAQKHNVSIIPVDSEHSAIFQCLVGNDKKSISKLLLTASGGPFRGKKTEQLEMVKPEDALKHPNWKMGNKITIDSATLMNKGLEVIEARWLFDVSPEKIEVLIHPQSIIHSMVEYVDGSIIAQLGMPDMRIPIQYAITYPNRQYSRFNKMDFKIHRELTFEEPDYVNFPCLRIAFEALKESGTMPTVMNAANEVAVNLFLNNKIRFTQIPVIISNVMDKHIVNNNPTIDDIIEVDEWARIEAMKVYNNIADTVSKNSVVIL